MADHHPSRSLMACSQCGAPTVVDVSDDRSASENADDCHRRGADTFTRLDQSVRE